MSLTDLKAIEFAARVRDIRDGVSFITTATVHSPNITIRHTPTLVEKAILDLLEDLIKEL